MLILFEFFHFYYLITMKFLLYFLNYPKLFQSFLNLNANKLINKEIKYPLKLFFFQFVSFL